MHERRNALLFLAAAMAASWSGPLVRLAGDIPPLTIAVYRTSLSTAVLLPFALSRRRDELRRLRGKDFALLLLSAAFLAIHFATWIQSINLTTVASSVLLVATTPVFVAGASAFIGESPGRRGWIGIGLALAGAVLVAGADLNRLASAGVGNGLAIAGGASGAGHILTGRVVRRRLSLMTYAPMVWGFCALMLLPAAVISRQPLTGFPARSWVVLAAIVIGPQLIAHGVVNFLLQQYEAAKVALVIMAEPLGASLIAFLLFDEIPGPLILPGGVALLAGIAIVLTGRREALISSQPGDSLAAP